MRPLAVLRPEPGASATLARAQAMGLEVLAIPLFAIEPLPWTLPDPREFDALLLTSANAVHGAGGGLNGLKALPVHAVGAATGKAAASADLTVKTVGTGGIRELLEALPAGLKLLHLCGEHRRALNLPRQQLTSLPIYRSAEIDDPGGLERLAGAVVLVHSPRAGRRLSELMTERSRTVVVAISAATADACGSGWERVAVSERPEDEAMLSLAETLCKESLPK